MSFISYYIAISPFLRSFYQRVGKYIRLISLYKSRYHESMFKLRSHLPAEQGIATRELRLPDVSE